jgi:copper transport protein
MRRAVVIAAALAALACPSAAFAHAALLHESPSYREELSRAPRNVTLRFDQQVDALPNAIVVLDRRGVNLALQAHPIDRGLVAPLRTLPRGPYTVRWKALSSDGHVVSGVYTFGVRVPAAVVTDAVGAGGPTTSEHIVRWVYLVGLALFVGGIGFQLLVLRGAAPTLRFYLLAGAGALVVLEAGIVAFLLRAEDALQLPFRAFLYGDLSSIAGGTRFGQAFIAMELGFSVAFAFLFLAWLTDRVALLWPAFALGVGFASGLSLSGHSSVSRAEEIADWAHLLAAALWVGGLVHLAVVVWPRLPELRRTAFRRFSRLATVCVAVLLAAGTYLSIERLPHLRDLWETGYGQVLIVKLALVALALAWGAVHQFLVLPQLERGRAGNGLARSLLGESAVAMSVLLAAAVLVDSKPPPQPLPQPTTAAHRR